MSEEELNQFLAKEQNTLDHLTRKIYGPSMKFERLSPFGQYTIESLARERALASDPDPELRHAKAEVVTLRREIEVLTNKLADALQDNQELWEENEELKMEIYDYEEDRSRRPVRRREDADRRGISESI